jgi:hypothetical protein
MDAGRPNGDPDLPRARLRILHRLVAKVLGRTELVQNDSMHGVLQDDGATTGRS